MVGWLVACTQGTTKAQLAQARAEAEEVQSECDVMEDIIKEFNRALVKNPGDLRVCACVRACARACGRALLCILQPPVALVSFFFVREVELECVRVRARARVRVVCECMSVCVGGCLFVRVFRVNTVVILRSQEAQRTSQYWSMAEDKLQPTTTGGDLKALLRRSRYPPSPDLSLDVLWPANNNDANVDVATVR